MSYLANTELVAKAWALAAVPGLSANVATKLPDLPWPNDEFIQIMSVGGTPDGDVPRFNPVISFNCYAVVPGSTKPPWGKAADLAMRVLQATYGIAYAPATSVELDIDAAAGVADGVYGRAQVTSCWPVSDIVRVPSDPSQYAVYNIDVAFTWTPVGLVVA